MPSTWASGFLLVITARLWFEDIKSGGMQRDLEEWSAIFDELYHGRKSKARARRKDWMNTISEAEKPKKNAPSRSDESSSREKKTVSDLDTFYTEYDEVKKKTVRARKKE